MQEIQRACRVRRAGALFLKWKLGCVDYGTWAKKEEPLKNGSRTIGKGKEDQADAAESPRYAREELLPSTGPSREEVPGVGRTPSRELGGGVGGEDMETTPSGNVAKKERWVCALARRAFGIRRGIILGVGDP